MDGCKLHLTRFYANVEMSHSHQRLNDGCVPLVDGPVQARLLFLPPDIDVGVPLQESTYDATMAALARVNQVGIAGLILKRPLLRTTHMYLTIISR